MSTAPQGWQTPKTNWQAADVVRPSDLNRIEGNAQAIESGSRTLDPSQVPSGNTGSLRQILSWFANRIRAITGAANWYDSPPATLAGLLSALNTHKSSADHDGRYYIKSQLDPIIRNLLLNHWITFRSSTSFDLNGVAYADGLWVAAGGSGTILTSTNGATWTRRTSSTSFDLNSVAYADGLWVAVGGSGTILTSTNGISWTTRSSGTSSTLNSVAYANDLWVAVGTDGTILTSTNGTSWTRRTSGTSSLRGVAYADGLWVAVGGSGTIRTSPDGTSWTTRFSGTSSHLNSVAYADGLWVAVGGGGTILTSTNAATWTPRSSTSFDLNSVAYAYAYADGLWLWVAVGAGGTISTTRAIFSLDP